MQLNKDTYKCDYCHATHKRWEVKQANIAGVTHHVCKVTDCEQSIKEEIESWQLNVKIHSVRKTYPKI